MTKYKKLPLNKSPQKSRKEPSGGNQNTMLCLPSDTQKFYSNKKWIPDNFALWLNSGIYTEFNQKGKLEIKKKHLREEPKFSFDNRLLKILQERQIAQATALFAGNKKELRFNPDWRLIIGIGSESVYETSITLHHIYGIPYIPASAIKGVTRNYAIISEEKFDNDELEALKDKDFCDIFGSDNKGIDDKAREGKVIFFDAFPVNEIVIEPDIMNVHYPEYYNEKTAPTDTQNPNPIFFLTIGKKTQFCLRYGVRSNADSSLLKTVETWLTNALEERGIGAKTAVGYGYMKKS